MDRFKSDYFLLKENDELKRRVDRLEQKMEHLQKQNMKMYNLFLSKNCFLNFDFIKEKESI